jgi:hypothetical protein
MPCSNQTRSSKYALLRDAKQFNQCVRVRCQHNNRLLLSRFCLRNTTFSMVGLPPILNAELLPQQLATAAEALSLDDAPLVVLDR